MDFIGMYKNGNYAVLMGKDGTKIRVSSGTEKFKPLFPESIDLKICNRCNFGCKMCHENSTPDGALADLDAPVLDTLHPYTELAIGGGNPLEHPGLPSFLARMKEKKIICNMTVRDVHLVQNYGCIANWLDDGLIHGLGVSVSNHRNIDTSLLSSMGELYGLLNNDLPNVVYHVIAGYTPPEFVRSIAGHGENVRLLILGYKKFGRGAQYEIEAGEQIDQCISQYRTLLPEIASMCQSISFDNLAVKQLCIRDYVADEKKWDTLYMGDDGEFTMYMELVKNEYAVSSVSERMKIPDGATIDRLFASIRASRT